MGLVESVTLTEKENAPGFAEGFRMPNSPGEAALLSAGRLFKTNATSVAAKFVAYELAEDFVTQLDEAIQAIEKANQQQNTGLGEQTGGMNGGYGYCLGPAVWGDYVVAGALVFGRRGGVLRIYSLPAAGK